MKILASTVILLTVSFSSIYGITPKDVKKLNIGDSAPDFNLPATDGKNYTLSDFSKPDVLMIYFTGTHCPVSHAQELRLQKLVKDLKGQSFGVVAINPNHNDGCCPDEFSYSKYTESFEDSVRYAKDLGWNFPFLYDGEKQITARAYGVTNTPHVFIFDKERKLQYVGRFDDSRFRDDSTVKKTDAENAIKSLLAGQPVLVASTSPFGCSTKWREKKQYVIADDIAWKGRKAIVEKIDSAGIKKLRANGTHKLRMFNVWSTDCIPCVQEMPEFTKIVRRYSRRNFDLITISLDNPNRIENVKNFLGKHQIVAGGNITQSLKREGRTTNNYLLTDPSIDNLIASLDSKWDGSTPYTIIVNTAGEIVYRKSGKVDPLVLKTEILKEIKEYFVP